MEIEYPKVEVGRATDLTNKKFSHWTVLYRTNNNKQGKTMWVCQCDCEKQTIKPVQAAHLISGGSTNCGCERNKMLQKLAIKKDQQIRIRDKNNNVIKKKCPLCNTFLDLSNFNLDITVKDGHSAFCRKCINQYDKRIWQSYKRGAKRRNLNFNLEFDDFIQLITKECVYCGEKPKRYNGIDRVDSLKGYELNNCVPCCEMCNMMKRNYTKQDFLYHIQKIYEYQN